MAHTIPYEKQIKVFIKISPYPLWIPSFDFSLLKVSVFPSLYYKCTSPLLFLSVVWNTYHKNPCGAPRRTFRQNKQLTKITFSDLHILQKLRAWSWTRTLGLAENWQIWVTRWGKGVMKTFVIQTKMIAPWIKPKKHMDGGAGFRKIASTVSPNT